MQVIKFLDSDDVLKIYETGLRRQERFPEESALFSLGVALMNYGEKYVRVRCVNGEWEGTKAEIPPRPSIEGVPLCPNGHVMWELSEPPKLALVQADDIPQTDDQSRSHLIITDQEYDG